MSNRLEQANILFSTRNHRTAKVDLQLLVSGIASTFKECTGFHYALLSE